MWDPFAELRRFQLPNGLTVYLGTWDRPWLKVGIMVHSGAKNDPQGKEGVAHFVEHLLIENARPWSCEKADLFFEQAGGFARFGTTYYDGTSFSFSIPLEGNNLEQALDVFGRMLIDCHIEQFIERERRVITREFTKKFPMRWMADRILKRRQLLFAGTNLSKLITALGTPESVEGITDNDLQMFYDQHYTPANITIVAVGGLETKEFTEILNQSPFGLYKPGYRTPLAVPISHLDPPQENRFVHKVSDYTLQKLDNAFIESYAAIPGTIRLAALQCVSNTLRRLFFREIREKRGWTYGFNIDWTNFVEACEFSIVGTFPWENLDVMEDLVDECLLKAHEDTGLIKDQIHRLLVGHKIIDTNGDKLIGCSLNDLRVLHLIMTFQEEDDEVASLTVEEVRAVIELLKPERRWTIITNP